MTVHRVAQKQDRPVSTPVVLLTLFAFALLIRYFIVLRYDFPINDGGMFYTMTAELQANAYRLPEFTSYNYAGIPFAYPPLPFYLTGALQDVSGVDLFTLLRLLPALFSSLSVPAFFLFSRSVFARLSSTGEHASASPDMYALLAALVFAIQIESFRWDIMGGGVTRAPAFLFSILALYAGMGMFSGEKLWRSRLGTALFASLAALCHLEIAFVAMLSLVLLAAFFGRNRQGLLSLLLVTLGLGLFTAPYWLSVLSRHGLAPFLYAFRSGEFNWISSLVKLLLIHMTLFDSLFIVLALLACCKQLFQRAYFLPLYFVLSVLLNPRSAPRSASIAAAMLVSVALIEIVLPAFQSFRRSSEQPPASTPSRAGMSVIAYLLLLGLLSTLVPEFNGASSFKALPAGERQAMRWVQANTAPQAAFLVLTPASLWAYDSAAEWFPALAERASLATVQGSEWLPDGRFETQKALSVQLRRCALAGLECLEKVSAAYHLSYSHLYLSEFPWQGTRLEIDLRSSPHYQLVYEQNGIIIFTRSSAP